MLSITTISLPFPIFFIKDNFDFVIVSDCIPASKFSVFRLTLMVNFTTPQIDAWFSEQNETIQHCNNVRYMREILHDEKENAELLLKAYLAVIYKDIGDDIQNVSEIDKHFSEDVHIMLQLAACSYIIQVCP